MKDDLLEMQYPAPAFPQQPQPLPGLAQKMQPQPDHGKQSYIGSGTLASRKALIAGADSGIGCAGAMAYSPTVGDCICSGRC